MTMALNEAFPCLFSCFFCFVSFLSFSPPPPQEAPPTRYGRHAKTRAHADGRVGDVSVLHFRDIVHPDTCMFQRCSCPNTWVGRFASLYSALGHCSYCTGTFSGLTEVDKQPKDHADLYEGAPAGGGGSVPARLVRRKRPFASARSARRLDDGRPRAV